MSQVPFDPHERAELAAVTASDLATIGDWDDQQAVQQVATPFVLPCRKDRSGFGTPRSAAIGVSGEASPGSASEAVTGSVTASGACRR